MFLVDAEVWRAMSSKRVARCDVDHGAADCCERPYRWHRSLWVPKDRFAASDSQPHAHVSLEEFIGFRFRTSIHHPDRVLAWVMMTTGSARRGQRPAGSAARQRRTRRRALLAACAAPTCGTGQACAIPAASQLLNDAQLTGDLRTMVVACSAEVRPDPAEFGTKRAGTDWRPG